MTTKLLALAQDLSQRAEIVRLTAQEAENLDAIALATAAWAITIELECVAETLKPVPPIPGRLSSSRQA